MIELIMGVFVTFIIYFIGIFIVSFLGGSSDVKSVATVTGIFTGLSVVINILGIPSFLSFGIMGFASIFSFVKFFDFEPMPALMAGFLFSAITSVILSILFVMIR